MFDTNLSHLSYIFYDNIHTKYPYIVDFYNTRIINRKEYMQRLKHEIEEWFNNPAHIHYNISDPISIVALIQYVIDTNIPAGGNNFSLIIPDLIKKYSEKKRNQKKYLLRSINAELGTIKADVAGPKYIHSEYLLYKETILLNPNAVNSLGTYKNEEDFIKKKAKIVEKWAKNKASLNIEFPYAVKLSPSSLISAFLTDLTVIVLNMIQTDFYNNPDSGYITKMPDKLFSVPVFSSASQNMQLEYQVEDGKLQIYNDYHHNQDMIRTLIEEIPFDTVGTTITEQEYLLNSIKKNNDWVQISKTLDMKDFIILSYIYSSMTADTLRTDTMTLSLKSMAESFFNHPGKALRTREYYQFIEHLEKLATYRLIMQKLDDNGQVAEKTIASFFDIHYVIPEVKNKDKVVEACVDLDEEDSSNMVLQSGSFKSGELNFSERDVSSTILHIMPSHFLKENFTNEKNQKIYTRLYNSIEDTTAKAFLFILQTARLNARPKLFSVLPYSYFYNCLRFDMRPTTAKSIIRDKLTYLKDHHALIDFYEVKNDQLYITWLPLSDIEAYIYKISPEHSIS